jgi:hypothetical protein
MSKQPYKLYTDKIQDFECQLYLEGIPLEEAKARMIVEGKNTSLTFGGTINKKGNCSIPIGSLGNKLGDISGGLMRLEVLAGDIFFQPWKSSFIIEGREFNEPININGVNESVQNSLEIELELNNMKQDIKDISEKVSDLSKTADEKYTDSVKKWTSPILDLDKIKRGEPQKISEGKVSGLNELLNKNHKVIEKKVTVEEKEENYKGIVDNWGVIDDDEDFEI